MSHAASLGGRAHRCARKWTTKHAGTRVWVMGKGADKQTTYTSREYYRKMIVSPTFTLHDEALSNIVFIKVSRITCKTHKIL